MKIQFIWDEDYIIGDPQIDEHHKGMFELASQLPDTLDVDIVKQIIMKLFRYTRKHFSYEEEMMKRFGYPNLEEHRELHNDMITKLSDISLRMFDTRQDLIDFRRFIYTWIIEHIMYQDKTFFNYAKEHPNLV